MRVIVLLFLCLLLQVSANDGLILQLEDSAGKKDQRLTRLVAVYKEDGGTVSPFLKAGSFKAVFSGILSLKERSRLYFKFSGNGKVTLKIADKVVLAAEAKDFAEKISERLRLNPGEHPIVVEYESPASGEASLRVLWKGRSFPWEPIGPEYLKHEGSKKLAMAQALRHGRELTAQLNCTKCHSAGDLNKDNAMPEAFRDTPSLANAGNRFTASWMTAWIKDPKSLRPSATMPALLKHLPASDKAAEDLAAYLATRKTDNYASKEIPASFPKDGGDIFHKLGCVACHTRPDKKAEANRIPLNNIGWKFQKNTVLADFLSNPAKHYKWIRMPDFALKPDEALKLATYLISNSKPGKTDSSKGDAAKGKELYAKLGCASCHEPNSKPMNTPLASLKNFDKGCVKGEGVNYSLSDKDQAAITSFLKSEVGSLQQRSLAEFSERQIREVNCVACHQYDSSVSQLSMHHHESKDLFAHEGSHFDQSRPILTWFGEKLQKDYLEKVLAGKLDHRPRPWLDARMPAFKERAAFLAEGLAAAHGLNSKKEFFPKQDDNGKIGKKLSGTQGGFSCIICHDAGPAKALAAFEVKGIDLMLAEERLRPEYYLRWMLDPQRIIPNTKMPKFATDGTTALSADLEGDAEKQFKAIWDFLKQGRKLEKLK